MFLEVKARSANVVERIGMGTTTKQSYRSRVHYFLLLALTLFWGLNWPAMKIVLMEVPVWWFRAICLLIGGLGLMSIAAFSGQRVSLPKAQLKPLLICGVFLVFGWHIFTGYGLTQMPAGRSAIIAFTMPLWATIFSALILNETITKKKLAALFSGLMGLIILIGPDIVLIQKSPMGAFLMVCAAISWALGTVLFKRTKWSASTTSVAAWLLLFGAIPFVLGVIVGGYRFELFSISTKSIFAFTYVLIFPMMFCQWCYLEIVSILPANVAALSTLAIPLVGVLSSGFILDEVLGFQEVISLILITGALLGVLISPDAKRIVKDI